MASSAAHTTANLPLFRTLIAQWEAKQPPVCGFANSETPAPDIFQPAVGTDSTRSGKDVVVAFRTRPPLVGEAKNKFTTYGGPGDEHDATDEPAEVEFCPGISVRSAEPGVVVAHVPGMKWNGPTLTQKRFESDLAFGPDVLNEEVYARTVVASDVINLVLGGGVGCVLAYGQTGSGKTYTMEAIEHRIARDIFPAAEVLSKRFLASQGDAVPGDAPLNIFELTVTFLELLGKRAADLVEVAEPDEDGAVQRKDLAVMENKLGEVRPRLTETTVRSAAELEDLITKSLVHRRTSATHRNAQSSRSHAMLTIRVKNTLMPFEDEGALILVDLAGSERYEDSKAHDKQRMEESRENNKSLMNLKECVRAKAKSAVEEEGFVHIPFRMNKLTLLLKPIFDLESRRFSKTIIIAHVSPHIQDTAHSVSTLGYAAPFKTSPPKPQRPPPYDEKDPRTWDHAHTIAWLKREFGKRVRVEREAEWKVKEKAAKLKGKRVRPLEDVQDEDLPLAVDVEKLCPAPMTARHLGRLYTNEWVERCLVAASNRADGSPARSVDRLKQTAVEVYGAFNYLLLNARLKTRTAVMKSRKGLSEEVYGKSPNAPAGEAEVLTGHDAGEFDSEALMLLQLLHGEEYHSAMAALDSRREALGWQAVNKLRSQSVAALLEKYREEIDQEKARAVAATPA